MKNVKVDPTKKYFYVSYNRPDEDGFLDQNSAFNTYEQASVYAQKRTNADSDGDQYTVFQAIATAAAPIPVVNMTTLA